VGGRTSSVLRPAHDWWALRGGSRTASR